MITELLTYGIHFSNQGLLLVFPVIVEFQSYKIFTCVSVYPFLSLLHFTYSGNIEIVE